VPKWSEQRVHPCPEGGRFQKSGVTVTPPDPSAYILFRGCVVVFGHYLIAKHHPTPPPSVRKKRGSNMVAGRTKMIAQSRCCNDARTRRSLLVRNRCSLPSPCVAAASPRHRAATWRRVSHRSRAFCRAHACQAVHRRQHDERRRCTTCFLHAQRRSWRRAHGPVGSVPRAWTRWTPLWKRWWSARVSDRSV